MRFEAKHFYEKDPSELPRMSKIDLYIYICNQNPAQKDKFSELKNKLIAQGYSQEDIDTGFIFYAYLLSGTFTSSNLDPRKMSLDIGITEEFYNKINSQYFTIPIKWEKIPIAYDRSLTIPCIKRT